MRVFWTLRAAVAVATVLTGCAGQRFASNSGVDRNLLVPGQFADKGYTNPYDVIAALRSNWLEARGPNSFQSPTRVQVYLDGIRIDAETARHLHDGRQPLSKRVIAGVDRGTNLAG